MCRSCRDACGGVLLIRAASRYGSAGGRIDYRPDLLAVCLYFSPVFIQKLSYLCECSAAVVECR
jgi:hypothetical protein